MTFIGKQLVFLNMIFAMAIVAWAVNLYIHRIDWTEATVAGQKLPDRIAELQKQIQTERDRYTAARSPLVAEEAKLARLRIDTEKKLLDAQEGQFYEYVGPKGIDLNSRRSVRGLTKGPDLRERPLQGVDKLQQELSEQVKIAAEQVEIIQTNREERLKLSADIFGSDKDGKDTRAFYPKRTRLKAILRELDAEKIYLNDNRVNWDEQLAVLKRRNDQLLDRLRNLDTEKPKPPAGPPAGQGTTPKPTVGEPAPRIEPNPLNR